MIHILRTAACAALLAGLGVVATTGAGLAATLELTSSSGGVYDYAINLPSFTNFSDGPIITLSGLSGVTGASAAGPFAGLNAIFFSVSLTSTSVVLTQHADGATFDAPTGLSPALEITSSVLSSGAVDYAIDTGNQGTITGTVEGPVASPVPEPSTWAMLLAGFAGLGFAGYRRAKQAVAASA
jgi:hypothetical protein